VLQRSSKHVLAEWGDRAAVDVPGLLPQAPTRGLQH
ncbi:hypothetical protein TSAR_013079, partial [Trichomalopsis sarcophagae]